MRAVPRSVINTGPVQTDVAPDDSGAFTMRVTDVQILYVDLQAELTKSSQTNSTDAIAANAGVLAKIAGLAGVPLTFSLVPVAGKAGRLLPELSGYATDQNTKHRTMAPAFMDKPLVETLSAHQRPSLLIAGYATEVAVLHAVLGALAAGYQAHYVVDAMGSRSQRTEEAAFRQMELAGAIPTCIQTIAAHFAPDFTQSTGAAVLETFASLRSPH